MKRVGAVLGLHPARFEEYERYHERIWPEIETAIREAGIGNDLRFVRKSQSLRKSNVMTFGNRNSAKETAKPTVTIVNSEGITDTSGPAQIANKRSLKSGPRNDRTKWVICRQTMIPTADRPNRNGTRHEEVVKSAQTPDRWARIHR